MQYNAEYMVQVVQYVCMYACVIYTYRNYGNGNYIANIKIRPILCFSLSHLHGDVTV